MSLTASRFVVFLLSLPVVQGQDVWGVTYSSTEICAVKGSTVEIRCRYTYPYTWRSGVNTVEKTFWFTKQKGGEPVDLRTDSEYAGRVETLCGNNICTLRIRNLRESDSAQYRFKFKTNQEGFEGSPGVTLSVTDPDLVVEDIGSIVQQHYPTKLQCESRCVLPHHPSYIWYKNGQYIWAGTSSSLSVYLYSTDSFACALKGHEDFPSPSECFRGQTCKRVTYSERSICAPKGSSVDISCTYSSYGDHVKFWFRPERGHQGQNPSQPEDLSEDSRYKDRVQLFSPRRGRSTLRIPDLRDSDSAQYLFTFKTRISEWRRDLPGTTLTVTALQVQVIKATVHQSYTSAELKCHSSCRTAWGVSYVWFKNREEIMKEQSYLYKDRFYPGDIISCALKGHKNYSSPLLYALKFLNVSVSPFNEIMEGSTVSLTCGRDANEAANYTWYKKSGNEDSQPLKKKPHLVFSSIHSSDSGEYYCTAENELGKRTSENTLINVKYAPKLPSVSVSPSAEIEEGSSVTLTCSSDANPAANYTWYKEYQTLPLGREGSYHFPSISSEDRGIYYCKSENQYGVNKSLSQYINVQYAPRLPSVSVSPSAEIEEGSSVNLTCSSDANPAANYTWYKENEDSPKASGQIFTITDFRAEHSGCYSCEAQNKLGRSNSTLYLIVVTGAWNSTAVGITTVVVLAVILLFIFLLIRKKKGAKRSPEPEESPVNRIQGESVELLYANIKFSKTQAVPPSSNISPAQPHGHREEDNVMYAEVKFNSAAPRRQKSATEEYSTALYSS